MSQSEETVLLRNHPQAPAMTEVDHIHHAVCAVVSSQVKSGQRESQGIRSRDYGGVALAIVHTLQVITSTSTCVWLCI